MIIIFELIKNKEKIETIYSKELSLALVKQNGEALEYVSDELKNDREIVMEAVKQDGCALEYVPNKLRNDKEIVIEAVKHLWMCFEICF